MDTICSIDVESQRSVEKLEEIEIYPAVEVFMTEDQALRGLRQIGLDMEECTAQLKKQGRKEEAARLRQNVENFRESFQAYHGMVNLESYVTYFAEPGAGGTGSFFDYFEGRDVMVYLDEPNRCVEKAEAVEYEFRESMSGRLEKGYILPKQMDVLHSLPQLLQKLQQYPLVLLSTLDTPVKDLPVARFSPLPPTTITLPFWQRISSGSRRSSTGCSCCLPRRPGGAGSVRIFWTMRSMPCTTGKWNMPLAPGRLW